MFVSDFIGEVQENKRAATKKPPLESTEQMRFVKWFKENYPCLHIISIRNDGTRTGFEKTSQKLMGLCPGASDLFIPELRLFIEMKRTKGSNTSQEQKDFINSMWKCGYRAFICHGFEEAKYITYLAVTN